MKVCPDFDAIGNEVVQGLGNWFYNCKVKHHSSYDEVKRFRLTNEMSAWNLVHILSLKRAMHMISPSFFVYQIGNGKFWIVRLEIIPRSKRSDFYLRVICTDRKKTQSKSFSFYVLIHIFSSNSSLQASYECELTL